MSNRPQDVHDNTNETILHSLALLGAAMMGPSAAAGFGMLALASIARGNDDYSLKQPEPANTSQPTPQPIHLPEQSVEFLKARRAYMRACQLAGHPLDIAHHEAPALLQEVHRHRWIEAEKAGRDIWSEMEPKRPERAALRDWVAKHYVGWRQWRTTGATA